MIGVTNIGQILKTMTIYEILSFNRELLRRLCSIGVRPDDCRFVDLYSDYLRMKSAGEKTTYIVAVLAERYGICERKVYDVIRRLSAECMGGAVG